MRLTKTSFLLVLTASAAALKNSSCQEEEESEQSVLLQFNATVGNHQHLSIDQSQAQKADLLDISSGVDGSHKNNVTNDVESLKSWENKEKESRVETESKMLKMLDKLRADLTDTMAMQSKQQATLSAAAGAAPHIASNSSLRQRMFQQLEYELAGVNSTDTDLPLRSKIVVALLEGFMLPAVCGIDRCYMGQPGLGVLKGITCGGFGFWLLADFVVLTINLLTSSTTIQSFGFHSSFPAQEVRPAMIITVAFLVFKFLGTCINLTKARASANDFKDP